MGAKPETVKVTSESSVDELLALADQKPVLLEREGTVYRLSRDDTQEDIWAGYDPDKVLQALDEYAGTWADVDTESLIADIYEARERGSRHFSPR